MNVVPNDILLEFVAILDSFGLSTNNINVSGKLTRCKALGDKKIEKSGVYFIKPDYPYNYYIMNFRDRNSVKSNFKRNKTRSPINYVKKEILQVYDETIIDHNKCSRTCAYIYKQLKQHADFNHPYIKAKKIVPTVKCNQYQELIIPGVDINGQIWTLQKISPDGRKKFISGSRKSDIFHVVGIEPINVKSCPKETIFLSEGYATAVSIYMSNKHNLCVAAFDAGNIIKVATQLKQSFPNSNIIICADLDYVGIKAALNTYSALRIPITIPYLPINDYMYSDFNDILQIKNHVDIDNILQQAENMKLIMIQAYELLQNKISMDDIADNFRDLAQNYIHAYYSIDMARHLIQKSEEQQFSELSTVNPDYVNKVKLELIKLMATKVLYNKFELQEHFLLPETEQYILDHLLEPLAMKIAAEETLIDRRAMFNKVNPKFNTELSKLVNFHFYNRKDQK